MAARLATMQWPGIEEQLQVVLTEHLVPANRHRTVVNLARGNPAVRITQSMADPLGASE